MIVDRNPRGFVKSTIIGLTPSEFSQVAGTDFAKHTLIEKSGEYAEHRWDLVEAILDTPGFEAKLQRELGDIIAENAMQTIKDLSQSEKSIRDKLKENHCK